MGIFEAMQLILFFSFSASVLLHSYKYHQGSRFSSSGDINISTIRDF